VIFLRKSWICGPEPDASARMRLFCFPYAGGGATAFHSWRSLLGRKGMDLCCVQLPGRETRFREPPITAMDELVARICDGIDPYLDLPFSLFGHSMGTIISFEVTRELARRGRVLSEWLLMSGAVPPHRRPVESLHTLPTAEFIDAVARCYNGLPSEVLTNQDLLDLMMPVLRADFQLVEGYRYKHAKALPVKITAFGGRQDSSVPPIELQRWSELTAQPECFQLIFFEGDHFFLNHQRPRLLAEIARVLTLGRRSGSLP
jgi:medium-chain acyl-[acyl-carrier-protein] hydrolase